MSLQMLCNLGKTVGFQRLEILLDRFRWSFQRDVMVFDTGQKQFRRVLQKRSKILIRMHCANAVLLQNGGSDIWIIFEHIPYTLGMDVLCSARLINDRRCKPQKEISQGSRIEDIGVQNRNDHSERPRRSVSAASCSNTFLRLARSVAR